MSRAPWIVAGLALGSTACAGQDAPTDAVTQDGVAGAPDAPDCAAGAGEALAWAEVTAAGPPPRWGHVAGFDAKRNRMWVFGGTSADGRLGDLWRFSGGWTEVKAAGGPSARFTSGAVMDAERDRWIVMSGDDKAARDDVWALALDTEKASLLLTRFEHDLARIFRGSPYAVRTRATSGMSTMRLTLRPAVMSARPSSVT